MSIFRNPNRNGLQRKNSTPENSISNNGITVFFLCGLYSYGVVLGVGLEPTHLAVHAP